MTKITVYSKPACVQCTATYKDLSNRGLEFEVIDVTESDEGLAKVQELGYLQAPVVIAGDDHWSGYRPDKIAPLASV